MVVIMNASDESQASADNATFSPEKLNNDNIVDCLISGRWEDVLLSLTSDMDPWDIDLVVLAERFMDHIKKTKGEDLRIPAKVILTAAILYRMKVDSFAVAEYEQEDENPDSAINALEEDYENMDASGIKIPPISVPLLRKPQGKISLDELINALDKAMTIKNRREAREVFQVELKGDDITESIEDLFEKICDRIGVEKMLKFSCFFDKSDRKDILRRFNSLLHLSNQERIFINQPEMFGEIYLTVAQQ